MNDHDRDLIMDLAEGRLSGDDAEAALARVSSDPMLAEELALQTAALAQLRTQPEIMLTEAERTDLRESIAAQLHLDRGASPTVAAVPTRRNWWWKPALAVSSVAAVLVLGIAVVPSMLSNGGDDAAFVAAEDAGGADESEESTAIASESAGGDGQALETTTTAAMAEAPPVVDIASLSDVASEDLLRVTEGAATPRAIERAIEESGLWKSSLGVDITAVEQCLEQLGDAMPPGDVVPVGIDDGAEGRVLYLIVLDELGGQTAVQVGLTSCSLVDVDTLDE